MPIGPGAFIAVIGGSGVGKDTLLDVARARCDSRTVFPRRAITRPAGPGEDYTPLDAATFGAMREGGKFAQTWHAHGLDYGIPSSCDDDVRAGRTVVCNVSRGVIDQLAARYERFVTVRITASDAVRAQRLSARGRESVDDVGRRLVRPDPAPHQSVDHEICNDGTIESASLQLLAIIEAARMPTPADQRTETS